MWLEKLVNDEQQRGPSILERTRSLIGQALAQQQRLWHLTQEVQQNLLAVGRRKRWTLPPTATRQDAAHAAGW